MTGMTCIFRVRKKFIKRLNPMYRLSGKMRESSAGKSSAFDTNYGKVWGDKSKREKFK